MLARADDDAQARGSALPLKPRHTLADVQNGGTFGLTKMTNVLQHFKITNITFVLPEKFTRNSVK